jgi:hypothetical protein
MPACRSSSGHTPLRISVYPRLSHVGLSGVLGPPGLGRIDLEEMEELGL